MSVLSNLPSKDKEIDPDRCPHCGQVLSRERAVTANVSPEADPLFVPLAIPTEYFSKPDEGRENERQHKRLNVKFKAAIRIGEEEEVVDVLDLSKGGMRFASHKFYTADTLVELAVPYMENNINIYVAAIILRVHQRPTSFPGEYALKIIR